MEIESEKFRTAYITSSEICKLLRISRAALKYAIDDKRISQPIVIGESKSHITLWERTPDFLNKLIEWQEKINCRRN